MESTDKNERLKPGSSGCGEYIVKSKVNEDIKNLQTSVAFLNEEIDKIKTGIPSEHFNPEEMLENNLTTWDATKQKLVTPTDPTSVKVGTEHLATEMDLFNTVHDVIDGTTPVEVVKVGTTDNEGSLLATKKSVDKTLEDYAKLTDVDEETKNRQIADNSIINGTTPIKAIDNEATNLLGNKVATYDNGLVNGLVEYKDGVLVHSTTDITADLAKEVQERKDADILINANLSSLTSRVATEEHKLASETDERQMIDEIIMQDAADIRSLANNAKNLATEAKAKADEVNALATEAKTQAEEANVNSAKAVADVATEVDNRTKADQTLQANIDKSIEYTAGVDGKLSIERGQRAEKDKILQENIDTVAKNLSDETFYRIEDDQAIQANIAEVVEQQKKVDDYHGQRINDLDSRLIAEKDLRNKQYDLISADLSVQGYFIDQETKRRELEDTLIRRDLKKVSDDLAVEAQTRTDNIDDIKLSIGTLQENIDNEAQIRTQADGTLQTNIDNEINNRTQADETLQTNIDNEVQARTQSDTDIINGTTPIIKAKAGLVDTEGNVFATSDDAFMLYGAQGRDNIENGASLDTLKTCGQFSVNSDTLANSITEKPKDETGPFDLIVGYFNTDNTQPYQFYIGKNSQKIFRRMTVDGDYDPEWKELGAGAGKGMEWINIPYSELLTEIDFVTKYIIPENKGKFVSGHFSFNATETYKEEFTGYGQILEGLAYIYNDTTLYIISSTEDPNKYNITTIRDTFDLANELKVYTKDYVSGVIDRGEVNKLGEGSVINTKDGTDKLYGIEITKETLYPIGATYSVVEATPKRAEALIKKIFGERRFKLIKTEKLEEII